MMQKPNFNEESRGIVTQVDPYLPDGAHMLVIDDLPAELILEGWKTREVRGKRTSYVGERIFLTLTGGKGEVVGTAKIKSCDGPLTEEEFHRQRFEHFVVGKEKPYKNTFTYQLEDVEIFKSSIFCPGPRGQVWRLADQKAAAEVPAAAPPPRKRSRRA